MFRKLVPLSAALLLGGAAAPASAADEPTVNLSHRIDIRHVGGATFATVVCQAQADPGNPVTQIAVDTLVVCTVNNTTRRQVAPGGDSVVVVRAAVVTPITVCVSGEADFVDPVAGDLITVATGPDCTTYPG